jgi:hypothetical protein
VRGTLFGLLSRRLCDATLFIKRAGVVRSGARAAPAYGGLPAGGVAVRTTAANELNFAEQLLPQLIPATSLVTEPALLRPTDGVNCGVPPPPPPLQPVKVELLPALAVRFTTVPRAWFETHLLPQLIALSAEATAPLPVMATVSEGPAKFAAVHAALIPVRLRRRRLSPIELAAGRAATAPNPSPPA